MEAEQGTVAAVSCNDTYAFTKPVRDEIVLIAGIGVAGDVHAGVYVKHRGRVRADPTQPNFRQVHLIQQELFAEVGAKGYAVAAGNLGENVTTSGIDLLALPVGTILRFGPADAAGPDDRAGPGDTAGRAGVAGLADAEWLADVEGLADAEGLGDKAGLADAAAGRARVGVAGGEPLKAVLEVAAAAELDGATAASAVALAAAAARERAREQEQEQDRERAEDGRPAVVLAGRRNPCAQIDGFRRGLLKEVVGRDEDGEVVYKAGVMAVVLRGGSVRPGDLVTVELPPGPHAPLERV